MATLFALDLAPARAQDATWIGSATPEWNLSANWSIPPGGPPGANGTATFGSSAFPTITISGPDTAVGALQFNAPGYVFNSTAALDINGSGISSLGGFFPTFSVTNDHSMNFRNNSTAGAAKIVAGIPIDPSGFQAGFIKFFNDSTAGQATINTKAASNTEFHDSSTAGTAKLSVGPGGFIFFNETSTADHATITVFNGGQLVFSLNDGGEFQGGTSTAGNAAITSSGLIEFHEGSTAGNATITTDLPSGQTNFFDTSKAGTATFAVGGESDLNFFNQSSADAASIHVDGTSAVDFNDRSTARTAKITAGLAGSNAGNDPMGFTGGFVFFRGNSTAADAEITTHWASNIEFDDMSKAGNAP